VEQEWQFKEPTVKNFCSRLLDAGTYLGFQKQNLEYSQDFVILNLSLMLVNVYMIGVDKRADPLSVKSICVISHWQRIGSTRPILLHRFKILVCTRPMDPVGQMD